MAAIGGLTAVLLGRRASLLLPRQHRRGWCGQAQRAADMAAMAAAGRLASDPECIRRVCARPPMPPPGETARASSLRIVRAGAVATRGRRRDGRRCRGTVPVAGQQRRRVVGRARAGVDIFGRSSRRGAFRPIALHGARGPLAAVAAAEAQIGWPYVWGGESRAEGGFDCSGLIDFAYAAAGARPARPPDRGRPVAPLRTGDARARWRRATSCSSAPPPARPTTSACTSAAAWSWRAAHGRGCSLRAARRRGLGRVRQARRAAPAGTPMATRRSSGGARPPGAGRTCLRRSSSSGLRPMPAPRRLRWRRPSAGTRATSRQRSPTRSATARWRGRASPGVRARPRGCRRTVRLLPVGDRPRNRSRRRACTSRRCRRRRIRAAAGAR